MALKNLVIVPLRGGSKSIPNKNIKLFNGVPLCCYAIRECLKVKSVSKVVVATDSKEIWRTVTDYISDSRLEVFWRDPITATDEASTESVLLDYFKNTDVNFENLILVQATSPLIRYNFIEEGIEKILNREYDSVLSVVRQKRFFWKKNDNSYFPENYIIESRPRRQEFEGQLVENGAFYITSAKRFKESHQRLSGKIGVVEMPEDSYFEIDEPSDWPIVESLQLKSKKRELSNKVGNIKVFAFDVDGVLTDSGMYYGESGDELKKFNTRDGVAVKELKNRGIITAIITGEDTELVARRADKIGVDYLFKGVENKLEVVEALSKKLKIDLDSFLYVGDDLNDSLVLSKVGVSCCPSDAVAQNLKVVDYVSSLKGGDGVIRDVFETLFGD